MAITIPTSLSIISSGCAVKPPILSITSYWESDLVMANQAIVNDTSFPNSSICVLEKMAKLEFKITESNESEDGDAGTGDPNNLDLGTAHLCCHPLDVPCPWTVPLSMSRLSHLQSSILSRSAASMPPLHTTTRSGFTEILYSCKEVRNACLL